MGKGPSDRQTEASGRSRLFKCTFVYWIYPVVEKQGILLRILFIKLLLVPDIVRVHFVNTINLLTYHKFTSAVFEDLRRRCQVPEGALSAAPGAGRDRGQAGQALPQEQPRHGATLQPAALLQLRLREEGIRHRQERRGRRVSPFWVQMFSNFWTNLFPLFGLLLYIFHSNCT